MVNFHKVPQGELKARIAKLKEEMTKTQPGWQFLAISSRMNLYYFTGTMQNSVLVITPRSETLWVRRSYDRAVLESEFWDIRPMASYRDMAYNISGGVAHVERRQVSLDWLDLFGRYFKFDTYAGLDSQVAYLRSVKSAYELDIMEQCGRLHEAMVKEFVPTALREGMTECELGCEMFSYYVNRGHQGIVRFQMPYGETLIGHIGFGDSPLCPSAFDGASGTVGVSPAAPVFGSSRKLAHGDLVYLDTISAIFGYNTDKTFVFSYGKQPEQYVMDAHKYCLELQDKIVALLKPGAIPQQVYEQILAGVKPEFLENFMGKDGNKVRFLGHSVGLTVDEPPVIASGFTDPIEENMTFAIEPKYSIPGVGMVGIENTFVVEKNGARCLTGKDFDILTVGV